MGVESYKHQFAKLTLAKWLRDTAKLAGFDEYADLDPLNWRVNRGGDHHGVWVEYPICLNSKNDIVGYSAWDEEHFSSDLLPKGVEYCDRPPTYEEVIELGLAPVIIFDVAIQHKGHIVYGLEVVHRNGISETKYDYLHRVGIPTYTIDADWILSRVKRPEVLVCQRVV